MTAAPSSQPMGQFLMPTRPSSPGPRIGIDLGVTKTDIAVLSRSGGYLLRRRVDTPRHDYEATVRTIAELVTAAEQAATESTLLWMSGLVDYAHVMYERALVAKADCENR